MFRRFSANFAVFSIFLDYILVAIALFLAAILRYPLNNYLPFLKEIGAPTIIPWPLYAIFPGHLGHHLIDLFPVRWPPQPAHCQ